MTAPLPGPYGPGASTAGGSSLVIFRSSRHAQAAWRLIEYLSEPDVQVRFYALTGNLPPRRAAWRDGRLAGGIYGVALGGAYFGESMFSRETDASKVALVVVLERLRERGFTLMDVQYQTPHLARFGTVEIPRREYERRLAAALRLPCRFDE